MRRKGKVTMYENVMIEDAYKDFINAKKAENLSDRTLATYDLHIQDFLKFYDSRFHALPTLLLNEDVYFMYVDYLRQSGTKKDVTITSYCRSVRAFLYWLQDNNYSEQYHLSLPKYQKTVKKTYTDEELSILLKYREDFSEVEYQTYVFINLVIATGLRLSSALNLRVNDVMLKTGEISINFTKNNVCQVCYISPEMVTILKKYIAYFDLNDDDWLFCTGEGNQLAIRTIQDNVSTYNRSLGVEKTSIHLFRHTFAKNFYRTTKDIYTLSKLLNHSSISITENYLKDLCIDVNDAVAYNPQKIYNTTETKQKRRKRKKR